MTLRPQLLLLGDSALLIRFGDSLDPQANRAAIAAAGALEADWPPGVEEIAPGLVSVLLRYSPTTDFQRLCGEVTLRLDEPARSQEAPREQRIGIRFDGEDLEAVAELLGLATDDFLARHNASILHVLATGFAPGFVYCGFHSPNLVVSRREQVRPMVPAGTVLFAAGQTAIAATPIRTGWHVIGTTEFRNFDAAADPPCLLRPGERVIFESVT